MRRLVLAIIISFIFSESSHFELLLKRNGHSLGISTVVVP